MPPKKSKVVVAPEDEVGHHQPPPAKSDQTKPNTSALSTSGGEPKRKAARAEANNNTTCPVISTSSAVSGIDFLDDMLGNAGDKGVSSSTALSTKATPTAVPAIDRAHLPRGGVGKGVDVPADEEEEAGVSMFKDESADKAKAAKAKEDALLKKGEELSGDALRKFMTEQFLNFDDDPVSDLERILGGGVM